MTGLLTTQAGRGQEGGVVGTWVTLNMGGGGLQGCWKYPECPTRAPGRGAHPPTVRGALPRGRAMEGKGPARTQGSPVPGAPPALTHLTHSDSGPRLKVSRRHGRGPGPSGALVSPLTQPLTMDRSPAPESKSPTHKADFKAVPARHQRPPQPT